MDAKVSVVGIIVDIAPQDARFIPEVEEWDKLTEELFELNCVVEVDQCHPATGHWTVKCKVSDLEKDTIDEIVEHCKNVYNRYLKEGDADVELQGT